MALLKTKRKKPVRSPITIRSLSVTQEDARTLDRLAQDASDYIGWTISSSALVRALIRHAATQNTDWQRKTLFSLIEEEIKIGTVWGRQKR